MKNKSGKVQMTFQNEISSREVKIGINLISQTTVKKTLVKGSSTKASIFKILIVVALKKKETLTVVHLS